MAKFLNTSAITYYLEELIKNSSERLILISPYLKLSSKIKELLEDKNRLKIDIRIIYGKSELAPSEASWLKTLDYVRTSFCENLHAKCYMSEDACIISSLNLYEFSQVNNNEMGVYISKNDDPELYKDAYEEAQRLIRVSDEVRIAIDKVLPAQDPVESTQSFDKLTNTRLASELKIKKAELEEALENKGFVVKNDKDFELTDKGKAIGAVSMNGRYGSYILWPSDFDPRV